ncbi:hypothetical protein [Anaerocolumna sp.]|uniref:hypothetical protein n=1 Tax=Anaerocolumna sp. TaxID=2041569 RepID=UPI0028AEA970|nr:hypothetical protein [Anaerocolumna sp.]
MTEVLQDYLNIYQRFPVHSTWKKSDRKERHHMLMDWQNCYYSQMPDMGEIRSFIKCNPDLVYERPFFLKVLVPCIYEDIENNSIDAIRFMFEDDSDHYIGTTRDFVEIFCEASDWAYTPFDVAGFILKKEPDNKTVLHYKYVLMSRIIGFTIHEVPYGILNGMNGAEKSAIPKMLEDLSEYEQLCSVLGENQKAFIDLCRRLYLAWDKYLDNKRSYSHFAEYLDKHHICYKE